MRVLGTVGPTLLMPPGQGSNAPQAPYAPEALRSRPLPVPGGCPGGTLGRGQPADQVEQVRMRRRVPVSQLVERVGLRKMAQLHERADPLPARQLQIRSMPGEEHPGEFAVAEQ